jgi:malate dehydrogenase (oxaloacetate-decarboxylating)(NADP+)
MSRLNDRPIVFALSNPTSKAECTAEQAYSWTEGRAIFASGSPYAPVTLGDRTYVPGQGNNAYVFPGVGLGAVVSGARMVTDEMFFAAASALAALVEEADLEQGLIYPPLNEIREVSAAIALAVAEVAYERELATKPKPDDIQAAIEAKMYAPNYECYV